MVGILLCIKHNGMYAIRVFNRSAVNEGCIDGSAGYVEKIVRWLTFQYFQVVNVTSLSYRKYFDMKKAARTWQLF
jgi:hypothetical protein